MQRAGHLDLIRQCLKGLDLKRHIIQYGLLVMLYWYPVLSRMVLSN